MKNVLDRAPSLPGPAPDPGPPVTGTPWYRLLWYRLTRRRGLRAVRRAALAVLAAAVAVAGWTTMTLLTRASGDLVRRPVPLPAVGARAWSVSVPTSTQAASTPWRPGPDPHSPDPDGDGLDARGCPYPNPYPDIVGEQDYEAARADPDRRVLRCSVDRRTT